MVFLFKDMHPAPVNNEVLLMQFLILPLQFTSFPMLFDVIERINDVIVIPPRGSDGRAILKSDR